MRTIKSRTRKSINWNSKKRRRCHACKQIHRKQTFHIISSVRKTKQTKNVKQARANDERRIRLDFIYLPVIENDDIVTHVRLRISKRIVVRTRKTGERQKIYGWKKRNVIVLINKWKTQKKKPKQNENKIIIIIIREPPSRETCETVEENRGKHLSAWLRCGRRDRYRRRGTFQIFQPIRVAASADVKNRTRKNGKRQR